MGYERRQANIPLLMQPHNVKWAVGMLTWTLTSLILCHLLVLELVLRSNFTRILVFLLPRLLDFYWPIQPKF